MDVNQMFCKVVTSGDNVEMYFYSIPIEVGKKRGHKIEKRNREEVEENFDRRLDNIYRSRLNVRRIIWCNKTEYTKFITLTYAETILDVKKVKRDITTFVQAMRRKGYDMNYLYVLEHQKERGEKEGNEGCIHVHMVLFLDKFVVLDDLNTAWKHGGTDVHVIKDIKDLGAYVCKYITKDNIADFGHRVYSCSLGLERSYQERYYTLGYSDSDVGTNPNDVLLNLDVNYMSEFRHDFRDSKGDFGSQTVRYINGKLKDPLDRFIERLGFLNEVD